MTTATPASEWPRVDGRPRHGLVEATNVALRSPSAWPIALAGFLARGGILVFVLPVVVLPTPTGLATLLGPDIIAIAIAAPTAGVIRLVVAALTLLVGWLVVSSIVGGTADIVLARWAAGAAMDPREGAASAPAGRPSLGLVARVAIVRLACHLPLAIAAVWAVTRIVAAVYREYISPGDLAVPLPLRVGRSVPDAIVLLLVAWLLGETLGGLAARGVALDGRPMGEAVRRAVATLVLHPVSAAAGLVASTVAVVALIAPPVLASVSAWGQLRRELLGSAEPVAVVAATATFASLWLAGLVAAGVAATVRSTIWTWHALRARASQPAILPTQLPAPESSAVEA